MEIILLENIMNLGNIGDKVTVKNGYGRNFLLRQGKALRFNKENLDFVNEGFHFRHIRHGFFRFKSKSSRLTFW